MSRKSLILCLAVLFVMLLSLGIAVAFLYSGTGSGARGREVSLRGACAPLAAVPSDAVLMLCSSRTDVLCGGVLSSLPLSRTLLAGIDNGEFASLKRCPMSVSLHYSGRLLPLYVFETGDMSELAAKALSEKLDSLSLHSERNGRFLLVSGSESLLKSSSRHLDRKISVADAPGFSRAAGAVNAEVLAFIPHLHVRKLLPSVGGKEFTRHSAFLERLADWSVFAVDGDLKSFLSLNGAFLHDGDPEEFLSILDGCAPEISRIGDVLPSYTISAVTLPLTDFGSYASGYESFVDTRQALHELKARQKTLGASVGITPEALFERLRPEEVAKASFKVDGKIEYINLFRVGESEVETIFRGNAVTTLRNYVPAVHKWSYPSFLSSVYGSFFALKDESCFTYIDGWVITGSRAAIDEFVSRNALDYTLNEYMADAGKGGALAQSPVLALAYYSMTEDKDALSSLIKPVVAGMLSEPLKSEYAPVLLRIGRDKDELTVSAELLSLTLKRTKAPKFERDTTVVVPTGPFKVRNSHTGKMNTFYQNASKAICLRDETGKDLWGVPFGKRLCGTAHNVDYYANGKLQIIFGAGSSVYVIDRLGRYVKGFPLDLGRDILLGPDVYDFSGARKYNIMVLHKDNTVEMYNLKGKKPEQWKGITASETIKSLPERLTLGGKDFWIVRTSIQTLIFPFYGGEPCTIFEGDDRIRPDSPVKVIDASSVEVDCYNGKTRTVRLK